MVNRWVGDPGSGPLRGPAGRGGLSVAEIARGVPPGESGGHHHNSKNFKMLDEVFPGRHLVK